MPRNIAVTDNFNRASLGASWSAQPYNDTAVIPVIVSSTQVGGNSTYAYAWYNAASFSTASGTLEAAVAVPVLPGNTFGFWLSFLQQPSNTTGTCDGYECDINISTGGNETVSIYEVTNGALGGAPLVTNASHGWLANDLLIIRLDAAGLIEVIRDRSGTETVVASVTDTTFTGTFFAGMGIYDTGNTCRLDDFSFGVYTPAGGDVTVTAPAGSVTFSAASPVAATIEEAPAGSVTWDAASPAASVAPVAPSGSVTWDAAAPSVAAGGAISAPAGSATFSAPDPALTAALTATPGSFTADAPSPAVAVIETAPTGSFTGSGPAHVLAVTIVAPSGVIVFDGPTHTLVGVDEGADEIAHPYFNRRRRI